MITKTKQAWLPGNSVRVGFLTLVVRAAVATPGDGMPDAYILSNATGTQLYKFVPHNGLEKIGTDEARILVANARHAEAARAATAAAQLIAACRTSAEVEAIFAEV
jgi:hypothetical protein